MKQVTAVVIGAGSRGSNYASYAVDLPDELKIVGVAEPRDFFRRKMVNSHNVPPENVFKSWEEAAARDKMADCVFVTTQDRMHKEPAIAFAAKGYHILLEKPMAPTYRDCCDIVAACKKSSVILAVCHVMRYTPQAQTIKKLIESGAIGDVININHSEPIGFWHFAHSFVRGNWRNEETSSFCLLAKSCHDIDLIQYWMGDRKPVRVSSFGSLMHFKPSQKPPGAGSRCVDCAVENKCPYSAKKIYLESGLKTGGRGWPLSILAEVPDIESITEALRTGPYGRCVYECDNNVVDNQVVNLQYSGGETVSFSMVAFTQKLCERQTKVFGTKGELTCDFSEMMVKQYDFLTRKTIDHDLTKAGREVEESRLQGHGGADFFAMQAFVRAVAMTDPSKVMTGPDETLSSHMLCFAAEKSRLNNCVLDLTKDIEGSL